MTRLHQFNRVERSLHGLLFIDVTPDNSGQLTFSSRKYFPHWGASPQMEDLLVLNWLDCILCPFHCALDNVLIKSDWKLYDKFQRPSRIMRCFTGSEYCINHSSFTFQIQINCKNLARSDILYFKRDTWPTHTQQFSNAIHPLHTRFIIG